MVHYDTIVIGLGAAGVTAATTLIRAGRRVLALEAQSRIGGRVHTVPFGNGLVELGAEWIHGNQKSRVFDLTTQHNITTVPQSLIMAPFRSDGSQVDAELVNELLDIALHIVDHPPDQPEPLGTFITYKLREYIAEHKPDLLKDEDFITEFLEFANLLTNNYEASNDWTDVTTISRYEELDGPQLISWHKYGYKTFFEIMLNTYKDGPGLPNLDIKLNTEVKVIRAPQRPTERVTVECGDGSSYVADNVIVTVSLGVLKDKHTTLFSPPLSKEKQTAIDKISIGVMDKVILSFDEIWWPHHTSFFGFIWKGDDKRKLGKDDYWTTRIYGASRPMGSSNSLTLWTSGNVAKQVETLPEETVKTKCVELLQKFIGHDKITVPKPTAIIRSTWHSNPYTRGSYSYDNLLTPQYPEARAWLGTPILDSSGAPRVLFAGEATNLNHFSTVHGASETGYREAMRLLPHASKI
ncbi:LOW QUALITY PROTEIN: spermine oxidase-like [Cydia pomonella]|uniref:LOW QUALITY PROTEIN: spermine oxidase-like n=1 Tax=Cydia pomonella TaxID=82600 RepID=UPI002ADDAE92|nr:LOW QUALITY PROTEIN: spermine oxidase-like [Cydia pomonella]